MIVGLRCPRCMVDVPWAECETHFLRCETWPLPLVRAFMHEMTSDERHATPQVTTTMMTACPLKAAWAQKAQVYVDPQVMLPSMIGRWAHERIGFLGSGPRVITEVSDPEFCTVHAEVRGVPYSGMIDAVEFPPVETSSETSAETSPETRGVILHDWKFKTAFADRYVTAQVPDEHLIQAALNAEAYRQTHGQEVSRYVFSVIPWSRVQQQVVCISGGTLEHALSLRPFDGDLSAGEILEKAWLATRDPEGFLTSDGVIRWGRSMKFGKTKTGCDYCVYVDICRKNVRAREARTRGLEICYDR